MAPAVGVESSTLLPAPRPLDVAMPAMTAAAAVSLSATTAADGDGDDGVAPTPPAPPPPGGASTALKLADCIGRVSAALAELGATVEALKGKEERTGIIEFTRGEIFSMMMGRERSESLGRGVSEGEWKLLHRRGSVFRHLIAFSPFLMLR